MSRLSRRTRLLLAVVPPVVAWAVQSLLWRWLAPHIWVLAYPAVILSSKIGGLAGGLVATGLSAVTAIYFFVPPRYSFAIHDAGGLLSMLIFVSVAVIFSSSEERYRRAREREALVRERSRELEALRSAAILREAEGRCRALFENTDDGILFFSMPGAKIVEVNEAACRIFGGDQAEFTRMPLSSLFDETHPGPGNQPALEGELAGFSGEVRMLRLDGGRIGAHITVSPLRREGGPVQGCAIVRDVTSRVVAAERQKAAEDRLHLALDAADAGIWEWDLHTNASSWSKETYRLFGMDPAATAPSYTEWLGTLHPEDRRSVTDSIEAAAREGGSFRAEWRVEARDRSPRWFLSQGRPERDATGAVVRYRGVVMDVTVRKQLEERLAQARRFETIGRLAGGIAHEINNALVAVSFRLESLRGSPTLDTAGQKVLRQFDDDFRRIGNLTRQLIMYSRQSVLLVRPLNLNQVVQNARRNLRPMLGESTQLLVNLHPGLPLIDGDASLVEQVIMNIVLNAREAMAGAGTITVSTFPVDVPGSTAAGNPDRRAGMHVRLSVADTGPGMDEAVRRRIFEPFFTTKDVGKGLGLGLSTAQGVVAQHRGWIEVESRNPTGSTFHVFFPVSARSEGESPSAV